MINTIILMILMFHRYYVKKMGHTQISTTKTFYYFDRHELDERKVYISKVQAL